MIQGHPLASSTRTRFWYGPDGQRYRRQDGTKRTLYLGNVEIQSQGSVTTMRRYVAGVLIQEIQGEAVQERYLYHDHVGSVVAVSNTSGAVVEGTDFGAFGERRGYADPTLSPQPLASTPRGYTGHEHVETFGIVHMNGRIYEPRLGRFLQADPYVQEPWNLQNHNRYTYVWNNPLNATDPSGKIVVMLAATAATVMPTVTVTATAATFSTAAVAYSAAVVTTMAVAASAGGAGLQGAYGNSSSAHGTDAPTLDRITVTAPAQPPLPEGGVAWIGSVHRLPNGRYRGELLTVSGNIVTYYEPVPGPELVIDICSPHPCNYGNNTAGGVVDITQLQTALSVAGMVPGIGTGAELINAGIYVNQGDWVGAGLSVGAAVPFFGRPLAAVRFARTMSSTNLTARFALDRKLKALQGAQQNAVRTRHLSDGRIRYCSAEAPAHNVGATRGRSIVTEYNPATNGVRQWSEMYSHSGKVNRVRPKMINGNPVNGPHYPPTARDLGFY